MTDQEFDQLFDNGESILETLDISTAHRINCPTDLMTNQHPITPPPELVQQWHQEADSQLRPYYVYIAIRAAQWGADQELQACCEWIPELTPWDAEQLRAARRPKPPGLKEQALAVLDHTQKGYGLAEVDLDTIRRALEALD